MTKLIDKCCYSCSTESSKASPAVIGVSCVELMTDGLTGNPRTVEGMGDKENQVKR